jgi:hypothetical protein
VSLTSTPTETEANFSIVWGNLSSQKQRPSLIKKKKKKKKQQPSHHPQATILCQHFCLTLHPQNAAIPNGIQGKRFKFP